MCPMLVLRQSETLHLYVGRAEGTTRKQAGFGLLGGVCSNPDKRKDGALKTIHPVDSFLLLPTSRVF